jgi:hypothetical protein
MVRITPNLMRTIGLHFQEAKKTVSTRNINEIPPNYIMIKSLKSSDKEKKIKAARST